ncbi:MAG: yrrB 5 [Crocinitomicaceae bacterium]|jgi:serine phosphatase RsbU (regulator of sigma subunit)|nr:yrrB 5 [Crocinitomicaceae bacterium]
MQHPDDILEAFTRKLDGIPDQGEQMREITLFSIMYSDTLGDRVIRVLERGIAISKEKGSTDGEIVCRLTMLFNQNLLRGGAVEDKIVIDELETRVKHMQGDIFARSFSYNMLAYLNWFAGNYEKGFNLIFEALRHSSEAREPLSEGWSNYALGVFYFDTKDFENSLFYYTKAFEHFESIAYVYGQARASNGIASVLILRNENEKALQHIEFAIAIYRQLSQFSGLTRSLNDLAMNEKALKNHSRAIDLFEECITLRREIRHVQGLVTSLTELGETLLSEARYEEALEKLSEALELAVQAKSGQKESRVHKLLSVLYKQNGNIEKALAHFERFYELNTRLMSDESANNIKRIQNKFEKEQIEKITEIEREKNLELQKAYELIEQKNKDISDSINYAQRIQQGILPTDEEIAGCFKNYFVLYEPKDIVSGDFYWSVNATSSKTDINVSLIAAVDCTGHGVPGAFMSMLGNTLLNQTIFNPEVVYPSDVLNFLNKELPQNLKSQGKEISIRDGMDMSICSFDFKGMKLYYAGANNPCWIIRQGEIIEIKGDKQPISAFNDPDKRPFTNNEFSLETGDTVYLFTDGYADQFGGPKGKKFKYRQFKEILLENYRLPLPAQKEMLSKAFHRWKGDLEQVDDVLVIGIGV